MEGAWDTSGTWFCDCYQDAGIPCAFQVFRPFQPLHTPVSSGKGQNRTLRLLLALWPPVFVGGQDVGQELWLDCQPGVFSLSDRFAEMD